MVIVIIEVYKYINKNKNWEFCYNNNIVYSYSDFIKNELKMLNFLDTIIILFLMIFFKIILIIQIILTFFFIIIKLKIKKKNILFNVLVYIPFLNSLIIKKTFSKVFRNKKTFKIIILNFLNIYLWGSPRIILRNIYISIKIIKSFKKVKRFNKRNFKSVLMYIYKEVYDSYIEKIEGYL